MTTGAVKTIKQAKRRCIDMGKATAWRLEYNQHELAPAIDNYSWLIDCEMAEANPCYITVLICIEKMAKRINRFCDNNHVAGCLAAQYWLERFLWRCDTVIDWDLI